LSDVLSRYSYRQAYVSACRTLVNSKMATGPSIKMSPEMSVFGFRVGDVIRSGEQHPPPLGGASFAEVELEHAER